jgi:hypothetical protein
MMKTYQFTVASKVVAPGTEWDGQYVETPGLITPPAKTDTPSEAMHHPETVKFCELNACTIYELVRTWSG